jgi:16S rRNA processing protein RimM
MSTDDLIILGKVGAPHGVKGWVKIHSHTRPMANIIDYLPWQVGNPGAWSACEPELQVHHKHVVARFENCLDRDQTLLVTGKLIAIHRKQLPKSNSKKGYYWSDLEGLSVQKSNGDAVGTVDHLIETGANDVLVIRGGKKELLIPFILDDAIISVDLKKGIIVSDWELE